MSSVIQNIIIVAVVVLIITAIVVYLVKAKKRGEHCIGCPYSKECNGRCHNIE